MSFELTTLTLARLLLEEHLPEIGSFQTVQNV